jgi:peptidoglycan/xylan/chitin deacetylase (PgdA/CDA1 family)
LKEQGVTRPSVVLTFDDGSDSDLGIAAPLLTKHGFAATFYLVASWIGKSGHLAAQDVRDLQQAGFEIGCHSMTHVRLTALSDEALRAETAGAKGVLEQVVGQPVRHLSCPFGFSSRRVADAAQAAAFESVATSFVGANRKLDPLALERIAVLRSTRIAQFQQWCHGKGLVTRRLSGAAVGLGIRVLGYERYVAARESFTRIVGR